ncbi:MAG: hypothetical protein HKN92_10225 [Chitinophagales bacterium]|nr:hypothetical protein [Chitinophagales bacterium]
MSYCLHCGRHVKGRSDKKYCSLKCKNAFFYEKYKSTKHSVIESVNNQLWRNRQILHRFIGTSEAETVAKYDLLHAGFNFSLITNYKIKDNRECYHYVYDYGWMYLRERDVLIVKKLVTV